MVLWHDVSVEDEGEGNAGDGTVWVGSVEGIRLDLSCTHPDFPDDWVLCCPPLNISSATPLCPKDTPSEFARTMAENRAWQIALVISIQMSELAKVLEPAAGSDSGLQEAAE